MRNIDKIVEALIEHKALNESQMAKITGLAKNQVENATHRLMEKNKIRVIGYQDGVAKRSMVYVLCTGSRFFKLSNYIDRISVNSALEVPQNDRPFSVNEMDYGMLGGKSYSWDDVRSEALSIKYKPNSSKNFLPLAYSPK